MIFLRNLPNIKITHEEYIHLRGKEENHGGEGIICLSDNNTLYKIFLDQNGRVCPMTDNKQRKLLKLYHKDLPYMVKPFATISYNGEMIGYEMSYDKNDISLNDLASIPRKELIKLLREAKEALVYFDHQDITYADVTEDNLLINTKTGKITFCDIDNMRVGTYPVDAKGYSPTRYYEKTGIIDAKADAYMHNLLTIRYLNYPKGVYDTKVMRDLRNGIYPSRYKLSAREIFSSMANPETFTGEYVIQYVKR